MAEYSRKKKKIKDKSSPEFIFRQEIQSRLKITFVC